MGELLRALVCKTLKLKIPDGVQMRELLNGTAGFHITERDPFWEDLIRSSHFHLCPRGNGPTSYRMYESLQAETIPIYIWSEVRASGRGSGAAPCACDTCHRLCRGRGSGVLEAGGALILDVI